MLHWLSDRKASSALIAAGMLWLISSTRAEVASDVSGFMTLTVKGHGGSGASALSFLGLGLTPPVLCRGTLESAGSKTITDQQAAWADDQYNGANGSHCVEICSGSAAGVFARITGTDAETKTLTLADDLAGALTGGEGFKIRKYWTLATLFGPQNQAGLGAGSNITADQILIYDPLTGQYTTYFYKTVGLGGTGWRSTASASKDEANATLDLTRGLLIRRMRPDDLRIKVYGEVKTGETYVPVYPGLNISGNVYPTDTLTLGNSGLFTGNPATGLAGGSNISADKILIYNGTTYHTYYYKTQGLGGIGWRSTSSAFADASGTMIPSGSSILIQRANSREAFYWVVGQPF